jgi:hypothetical protein
MQYVNDDSDELFRRAGKDYPLNTNRSNWETLANKLYPDKKFAIGESKNNNIRLRWLLLLIPLPWLCHHTATCWEKYTGTLPVKKANDLVNVERPTKEALYLVIKGGEQPSLPGHQLKSLPAPSSLDNIPGKEMMPDHTTGSNWEALGTPKSYQYQEAILEDAKDADHRRPTLALTTYAVNIPLQLSFSTHPLAVTRKNRSGPVNAIERQNGSSKRFYLGPFAGVNLTTVKAQQVNSDGIDLGVVAGYKINRRWHIEVGMFSVHKKYYTTGNSFNTSGIHTPANATLTFVKGNCRMLEWPVVIHYNLSTSKNTWYIGAGVTNFLMKQEDYDYEYLYVNSGRTVKYHKSYQKTSYHGLSAGQVSGGFHFQLPNDWAMRAELYGQIPLKGIGLGNLPLATTGLRLGITNSVF